MGRDGWMPVVQHLVELYPSSCLQPVGGWSAVEWSVDGTSPAVSRKAMYWSEIVKGGEYYV